LSLAFAHVGNGTDYFSISPLFFGRRVIDAQSPKRRPPTTALSKKDQPRGWLVLAFSAGGDGGTKSGWGRMANVKSVGWAIYTAGFVIWLFG